MRNTLFYIFFTTVCAVSFHSCATDGTNMSADADIKMQIRRTLGAQ